ncbi:MAG: SusC/RagA family TonB-linked outer membrane protein [Bacteroidales bacterium]|nr:SusC/RagA family TonB-linked outer membrane protein [Bacteroidales bacterium]
MKRLYAYIIVPLLFIGSFASAQEETGLSQMDSIVISNPFRIRAAQNAVKNADVFDKSPEVDIAKALYGQFSGLLVKQGTGRSEENQSKLRLHGHSPLIVIDGFPRDISDVTSVEIESVQILKDAASAALYGVRGGNGVVLITTKRGKATPLKVTAKYQYGMAKMFRAPEFADAYTYGYFMNQARELDGLAAKYTQNELYALYTGGYPYAYPNVNWWDQVYRSHGDNHRAQFTFNGGNRNFRYFAAIDYMKDDALYVKPTADDRYNAKVYDNRLGLRANVDVNLTETTSMKLGVMARLSEFNTPNWSTRIENILYYLPAAAFPIKQEDGTYGGSSIYGANNPVAIMNETGNHQYSQTKVLANMVLRQDLNSVLQGLSADASIAFDYLGKMTEVSSKEYQYSELVGRVYMNGVNTMIRTEQKYYGNNSKNVSFDHWFNSLLMRFEVQGRINWAGNFDKHHIDAHLAYRQRSYVENERNASTKTQEFLGSVSWNYDNRFFADLVLNCSGTAYLPKGDRFKFYPALNLAAIVSKEPYVKVYGSAGLSGADFDMEHELYRQGYGSSNGHSFYFVEGSSSSGKAEGDLAALTLAPELSKKASLGVDAKFFKNRLAVNLEGFYEHRKNILIDPSNISGVIGIGVSEQSLGEEKYKGADFSITWDDKIGNVSYGVYGNGGWLFSKVVNDGQAYQAYDYLYHKGNKVGQRYGLEVIGIFQNQVEINNSPKQTFSDVRPGDLKYRDQNGDGVIDKQDVVKMFGSTTPLFSFGFGLHAEWNGFKVFADFQGATGVTVSLLDSPLYQPLVSNGTISKTFLAREIPWTPENADKATMPRLTTLENSNNYRANSLWYRDGSFIKLRNVGVSYTLGKNLLKICDATVTLNATNLFSLDNIHFADPEQLGAYYPSTRVFWAGVKFNF